MMEYIYNMRKADGKTFISFQIVYEETPAITVKTAMQQIQLKEKRDDELDKNQKECSVWEYSEED